MGETHWPNGAVAAVSLTYDGTASEQTREVLPLLAEVGVRGTFYAYPPNLLDEPDAWRNAVRAGHELANHTFFEMADADGLIPEISPDAVLEEMLEARDLLEEFGSTNHSFAYPAVRTFPNEGGLPVVPQMIHDSIVRINELTLSNAANQTYRIIRTPLDGHNLPGETQLQRLRTYVADGLDAESLCVLAQMGISQNAWTILVFDGLRPSSFDLHDHAHFCSWLKQQPGVFVGPVAEVGAGLLQAEEVAR